MASKAKQFGSVWSSNDAQAPEFILREESHTRACPDDG